MAQIFLGPKCPSCLAWPCLAPCRLSAPAPRLLRDSSLRQLLMTSQAIEPPNTHHEQATKPQRPSPQVTRSLVTPDTRSLVTPKVAGCAPGPWPGGMREAIRPPEGESVLDSCPDIVRFWQISSLDSPRIFRRALPSPTIPYHTLAYPSIAYHPLPSPSLPL